MTAQMPRGKHVACAGRPSVKKREVRALRARRVLKRGICLSLAILLAFSSVELGNIVSFATEQDTPVLGENSAQESASLEGNAADAESGSQVGAGDASQVGAGEGSQTGASADAQIDASLRAQSDTGEAAAADAGVTAAAGEASAAGAASVVGDTSFGKGNAAQTSTDASTSSNEADDNIAPQMAFDTSKYIKDMSLSYKLLLDPTDEGYNPDAPFVTYDPDDKDTQPTISKHAGSIQLATTITWSDGTVQSSVYEEAFGSTDTTGTINNSGTAVNSGTFGNSGTAGTAGNSVTAGNSDAPETDVGSDTTTHDAGVSWLITASYAADGTELATSQLATIDANGKLSALGTGNGTVKVRCAANNYPDFAGKDILITITGNDGDARTITDAKAYVRSEGAQTYTAYSANNIPTITTKYGDCSLDALLTFEDGSTGFASEYGIDMHWQHVESYNVKGIATSTPLVKPSPNGMVSALGTGNGSATIQGSAGGVTLSVKVSISGNATAEIPDPTPVRLTFKYIDVNTLFPTSYSANRPPEIITLGGSCKLIPFIYWSDGSSTNAFDSGYSVSWWVSSSVDFSGNPTGSSLASVSSDGSVYAQGTGNGIVKISGRLVGANVPSLPAQLSIEIRGNDSEAYVKSVDILRSDGTAYGDDSIDLEEIGNLVQLYARVNYSDGTTKTTLFGDTIEGLTWANYRGTSTETDLYSEIDEDTGAFSAKAGFRQCRVVVKIAGGGFYDNDITRSVRIYKDPEEDRVGTTSQLTVHIIEESEYAKFGKDALSAEETTITVEQMTSQGNAYSDWFTYRKKNGNWGTIYAYGISIPSLLGLVGVKTQNVCYMQFSDNAGYTGDSGFYSGDVIMGSRYRYSNYYMHAISSSPSYLGQSSVVPMIAISYYMDNGNDLTSSGWGSMISDSCLRLILGMTGVEDGNARRMVRCLSDITVIVKDAPNEEEPEQEKKKGTPGAEGTGNGSGGGSDSGGGSGTASGVAVEGQDGGEGSGGAGSNGSEDGTDTTVTLRELVDNTQDRYALQEVTRDNPWRMVALVVVIAVLIISITRKAVRFKWRVKDGEKVAQTWKKQRFLAQKK